jgi:tetratricopeptide (TPR) repeat protein
MLVSKLVRLYQDRKKSGQMSSDESEERANGGWLHRIARAIVDLLLIGLVIAILFRLADDKWNGSILIEPFDVPKTLEEQGYTGRAVASKLADEIARIDLAVKTYAPKSIVIASNVSWPEIEIPETKLSLDTIVDFLETFFHMEPRINGELTTEEEHGSQTPRSNADLRRITITLRMTGMEGRTRSITMVSSPDKAIARSAREALTMINPYILAVYSYQVEKDAKTALQLASRCEGSEVKWARILEGHVLFDQHDYEGAIDKYKKATVLDPGFAQAYSNWGFVLASTKHDYQEALTKFQKAIDLDRHRAEPYYGWGEVQYSQRDYDGAIGKFRKAIDLDPNYADAYFSWAEVLYSQHDYDGAIARYQKAIELNPNHAASYNGWGNILYVRHDYNGAIAKYQKAIKLDPNYADAYFSWAEVLYSQHHYHMAIAKYEKAIKLDPNYAASYNGWGNILYVRHDYNGAIAKYQKAIKLDPQNETYRSNLKKALGKRLAMQ